MANQPSTSHSKRLNGSNQNSLYGDISQQQILDDIMMIAKRHDEEAKEREATRKRMADATKRLDEERKRLVEARAARERRLAEMFNRNLEQRNPERERAPYSLSGGLFAGQTIRPDPLISADSSNVNEDLLTPRFIFGAMPKLAPVRPPPQKQKPQEPS